MTAEGAGKGKGERMSEEQYRMALEEVYRLALRSDGKRERKTKQICRAMLGEGVCRRLEAEDAARRAEADQSSTYESIVNIIEKNRDNIRNMGWCVRRY
jgi:hypothetical protein